MKWMRWPRLVAAGLVFLGACQVQDRVAGGSSDETRTTVSVHGRVLDEQARGIEAVTVRLSQQAVEVVTDSNGAYAIPFSALDSVRPDTLLFYRDGLQVSSMPVQASWTRIPDLILFQREIAGVLDCVDTMPASATAFLLWNTREIDSVPLVLDTVQGRFSTFVWIGVTDTAEPFGVYVDYRDTAGLPVSRSPVQRFQRLPDEIVVGEFGCFNSIPTLALAAPDSAYRGEMILVRSGAASTIGLPLSVEWSFDNGQVWIPGSLDTLVKVPPRLARKGWRIRVRATDSRGISRASRADVGLKYRPPEVSLEVDSFVEINGAYSVQVRFQQNENEVPMECVVQYGIPSSCSQDRLSGCSMELVPLTRVPSDVAEQRTSMKGLRLGASTQLFTCSDTTIRILPNVVGLNRVKISGANSLGQRVSEVADNFLYPRKPSLYLTRYDSVRVLIRMDDYELPLQYSERSELSACLDPQWSLGGVWHDDIRISPQDSMSSILPGSKVLVRGVIRVSPNCEDDPNDSGVTRPVIYSDTTFAELVIP